MSVSVILPMAAFALAASISPGPVNILSLMCGTRYSISKGLIFVTGATIGFVVLFISIGLGLYSVMSVIPSFNGILRWAGILFLIYLSYQLWRASGQISSDGIKKAPGFFTGAMMQWMNPKAWLASASGIGAYTSGSDIDQTLLFAALYLPICWISLSCWVYAGVYLRRFVDSPINMIRINRTLALLLIASCIYLLIE